MFFLKIALLCTSLESNIDTASYAPAAYLQASTSRNFGSHRLAVETGRFGVARVEREQRLCQRCEGRSFDDVEHMIFDCTSLEAERLKHQSLFARGRVVLADFFEQDQIVLAAFVHGCFKACNE